MTVKASVTATIPTEAKVIATVYEDTDGDGTAENTVSVVLNDGANDYQFPSLGGDTANEYWIGFDLRTDDTSVTPEVDTVSVDPNPGQTGSDMSATTTLNGQIAAATVYEDTDGDGTAENQITTTLPDGTDTFGVFNLSGDATNDHWVGVDLFTSDTSQTPTVDALSLTLATEAIDSGSITAATATPQSPLETTSLSVSSERTGAVAVPLTAAESGVGTDAGSVVTAVATPFTAGELAETLIAGTVTLNGSGVQGAKVYVIDTDNDAVETTATTDTNGDYSVTVPGEAAYHVAVQYDDGSQKYNALSKPFVQ